YKNYKYNSTIDIAGYFANKGDFEKSYYYMHKADTEIQYETSSLTSFMYRKIELAIWKYHLLKDMKRNNEAVAVLITRAFEYDYKNMYPDWASFSNNQYEEELAQLICSEFNSLKKLMIEIDNGIENLIFDAKKNKI